MHVGCVLRVVWPSHSLKPARDGGKVHPTPVETAARALMEPALAPSAACRVSFAGALPSQPPQLPHGQKCSALVCRRARSALPAGRRHFSAACHAPLCPLSPQRAALLRKVLPTLVPVPTASGAHTGPPTARASGVWVRSARGGRLPHCQRPYRCLTRLAATGVRACWARGGRLPRRRHPYWCLPLSAVAGVWACSARGGRLPRRRRPYWCPPRSAAVGVWGC